MEGAEKRERPAAGSCGGRFDRRCGEGLGTIEEDTIAPVRNFLFFRLVRSQRRREAGLGAVFDPDIRG